MPQQYHILNGDALKEQFPQKITGEIIVARECLVDGDISGDSLEELFVSRAKFIGEHYGATAQEYQDKVVAEFNKLNKIVPDAEINLWFEDDLFCQVNFWFVLHLLSKAKAKNPIYLVRPQKHSQYGFGGLDQVALNSIYEKRILLTDLEVLSSLWTIYQKGDVETLLTKVGKIEKKYPFILAAAQAHQARIPKDGHPGRPVKAIKEIMQELQTDDFGTIFKEFCKRESIYGFGDLQVKRIYERIMNGEL